MDKHRVLIVTEGLHSVNEPSPVSELRKQLQTHRNSYGPWLDLRIKLQILERVLPAKLHYKSRKARKADYFPTVNRLLGDGINLGAPELTEVVLMTLLAEHNMPYEATTYSRLASDKKERERLLLSCDCIFASGTMLRGLPEAKVIAKLLKETNNRVVLGGALTGILHDSWPGVPGIDLLAVGYGEWLVPSLVRWIRSDFKTLEPPSSGRIEYRGSTPVLYSGLPDGKSLDTLIRPDWSLAERYHGKKFSLVHYESVRGCPYRCEFCNYPYLFDDNVFRVKSAERIASDWIAYSENGARIINCLDSLFTIPYRRLEALCKTLKGLGIRWICYARADDLVRPGVVERMREAGCIQVQIGLESGDQKILDNMNKSCSVESNLRAMQVCRENGLTTMVSVIIGFPGETVDTIRATLEHLREGMPDFYYASPFSVLVGKLPVLSSQSRQRFGLQTISEPSSFPYWRHNTMDSAELVEHLDWFNNKIMKDSTSLDASLFYEAMPDYCRESDREHLLAYQCDSLDAAPWLRKLQKLLGNWVQHRLVNDMSKTFQLQHPVESHIFENRKTL